MKLEASDIEPIVQAVVDRVLAKRDGAEASIPDGRLAYSESEAASLIGRPRHVVRDARLRGELRGKLVGKTMTYTRTELLRWLAE